MHSFVYNKTYILNLIKNICSSYNINYKFCDNYEIKKYNLKENYACAILR
jgi:hypothetical protein